MDTYASQAPIDSLGRRSGSRRRRPLEEKRRIVEETLALINDSRITCLAW
jgi:hypothetical protein